MNNRTRFAKCFIIIVEECKSWLSDFVENRVKTIPGNLSLEQFIRAKQMSNDPRIRRFFNTMKTSTDLDVTALQSIIRVGKLLLPGEEKTALHVGKTIGDYVDRIREIRNTFMHTESANLGEQDYSNYFAEFCTIAVRFERENNVPAGWYVDKLEKNNKTPLDNEAVDRIIEHFNEYVENFIKNESQMSEQQEPTATSNTGGTALAIVGGAVGLVADVVSVSKKVIGIQYICA
ncbi:Hypothetical predicted protein [Mytilus galloprovincialis]|uniref:DZIP3-like HEPN domain-containing protein n=1 Tax=Mytilus galloprovincialis TaxID=29158 RepID=A0A8B6E1L8_MYTGA|nr:Hypothetical predicted protein [Mytilus galloprovincialis]